MGIAEEVEQALGDTNGTAEKPEEAKPEEAKPEEAKPEVKPEASSAARAPVALSTSKCLKIDTFDSSVLSSNSVYTEVAWKVDVSSSCDEARTVRVTFTLYDKDEFRLDEGSEIIQVPAGGVGKARGKMLVSPPEKARRMAKQGVSIGSR